MSILATVKANLIIQEFGITNPKEIDLEAIAYDRGLIVQEKELNGCDGRIITLNKLGFIFVNSRIREAGKKRFVIAHELGHFELNKDKNLIKICDEAAFINWNKNGPQEKEANEFASEILFPRIMFNDFCSKQKFSKDLIIGLANYFNCSISSTALRYAEIGNIPIAVIFSQNKTVKWYRCNKSFPFQFVDIRIKVNDKSYAYDYFEGKDIPQKPEEIISDAWFQTDYNFKSNFPLSEQNIIFASYNAVLSLIWIKK
jgi:Zn-dependent peptidase ImmA (M78 family)